MSFQSFAYGISRLIMRMQNSQNYDSGIDVVRFFAFFLVFFHHFVYRGGNSITNAPSTYWQNQVVDAIAFFGSEGVTIFFCLSGYLLSKLLIRELTETGKLSVGLFYLRRALRIWPLYFSFLLFCIIASSLLGNQSISSSELPSLLTFTYNWQQIFTDKSRGVAAILWSISVEEQIYLFLPLLLVLFSRWSFKKLAFLLVISGLIARILFYTNDIALYRNTFSYMSTVGIGLYYTLYEEQLKTWYHKNRFLLFSLFSLFIFLYISLFDSFFSNGFMVIFAFDMTGVLALIFLLMLSGNHGRIPNMVLRPFAFLGRRTYGMYLFHWPILGFMVSRNVFFDASLGISVIGLIFALSLVIAVSVISYRFFESPFLNMRKKFQYVKVG